MNPERWAIVILIVFVLAAGAVGAYSYLQEWKSRVLLEATLAADKAQLEKLDAEIKRSDEQAATQVQVIEKKSAAVKTPKQAIAAIPDVSGLPISFRPAPDLGGYVVSPPDVMTLFKGLESCKEQEILLGACQVDRGNLNQKISVLTSERNQAVSTVKGGTFFRRLWNNSKMLAIGGIVGAGLYAAAHH